MEAIRVLLLLSKRRTPRGSGETKKVLCGLKRSRVDAVRTKGLFSVAAGTLIQVSKVLYCQKPWAGGAGLETMAIPPSARDGALTFSAGAFSSV